MAFFHHRDIYPYVDYVLTSKEKQKDLDDLLKDKCLFYTGPPKTVVEKLSTAKVLYVYPDTFDQWTDILLFIHQKKPLPVRLMIFADSDISLCNDHLDAMFAFFGETEFWVQNWLGYHPRCTLFPLAISNYITPVSAKKDQLLGISFLNYYIGCKAREEFFTSLNKNPGIQGNCFPKTTFQDYCERVTKCEFHTCPMGEGCDTFRFWESLALGTIPVVKEDLFYESLAYHYPEIPMLRLESWNDLQDIQNREIPPIPHLPYLYKDYWVDKIKVLLE